MKTGVIICSIIALAWLVLAIVQLWLTPLDAMVFIKISITAGLLFIAVLVMTIVIRDYLSEKKMKQDGYID